MYGSPEDWSLHPIISHRLRLPVIGWMSLGIGPKAESDKPNEEKNKRGMLYDLTFTFGIYKKMHEKDEIQANHEL